jgi:hypothetical protein
MKRDWLASFPWPAIVEINRLLCLPKGALHRETSDGFEATRALWESSHWRVMSFAEATELCRRCHRLAPFCNFNGNTFVAVIREVIAGLSLPAAQATVLRSLAGHIVAGIATAEEQRAFTDTLDHLSPNED